MPRATAAALLIACAAWCGPSRAAQLPLWEFGLGAGVLAFDDYRGAATAHVWPLPLPYFIYRGRWLRADRDGVHGRLLDQQYLEFDLSVYATAPVFSRSSSARAGMPNLDPTIEIGPALVGHLWQSGDERWRLDARLPLREAITVAAPPQAIGTIFAPSLQLDCLGGAPTHGWNLGLLAVPLWAQRRYHEYFYAVASPFATPVRPAYEPAGGYSGTQMLWSASRRFRHYWLGAYVRHDWLEGAAFIGSPLVRQRSYWAGGIGVVRMIGASATLVESRD